MQQLMEKPVKIDVGAVLRSRLGNRYGRIPRFVVRILEKIICQDSLNDLLEYGFPRRGADFCRAVLSRLGISLDIHVVDPAAFVTLRRPMFVSNHPLGGLDGMALIAAVEDLTGKSPYFVVNDLLMAVEPLSDVFVPVNKHGSQSRRAMAALDESMASDRPVIIFPAGMCSRRRAGKVADLEWKKMFIQKARHWNRPVVPVLFEAENSTFFYRMASLREKLKMKFNLEMILLPSEIMKKKNSKFRIVFGAPSDASTFDPDPHKATLQVRGKVYGLAIEKK